MEKFSDYDTLEVSEGYASLPVGIQKCVIKKAYENVDKQYIVLEFEIVDGNFKGYFTDLAQKIGKWANKGTYRLCYGSDNAKLLFKKNMLDIEATNSGYHWDWNEKSLEGKFCVINFREEEYIGEDRTIKVAIKPFELRSSIALKEGKINLNPARKCLSEEERKSLETPDTTDISDIDLPF